MNRPRFIPLLLLLYKHCSRLLGSLTPGITVAFAREGAKVAINYLPEEEKDAEALANFLEKDPCVEHKLIRIPGDLRSQEFCHELVHTAHKKLGSLDLIVSNAG